LKPTPQYLAKILVAGPVGSGKSTFVQTLSHTPYVETDVVASEEIGKLGTTVGIDFGTVDVNDMRILLFGVPGQDRFDFMWEIAGIGAHALLLAIASDRPACFVEARKVLRFLRSHSEVPVLVGLTRTDLGKDCDHSEVGQYLDVSPDCILKLDARNRESCMQVLRTLFEYFAPQSTTFTSQKTLSLV
jgi:signal recognition particle receptor subunit beta